jgi:hypothetical protein
VGRNQPAGFVVAAVLTLLGAACTSGSPPRPDSATGYATSASASRTSVPARTPAALAREGLLVPSTYQEACANEGSTCLRQAPGSIPAVLKRSLHFPVLRPGQRCPASHGRPVDNSQFGGIALGTGPVRPIIAEQSAGDARRGIGDLSSSSVPGWLAFKTLWFSVPAYQGPFVIRAIRLARPGMIAMGEGPTVAPLVVPPGPTVNGGSGWRTAPGGTWVKSPGCYAWQVDGLMFSEIIVVSAVLR